jgi:RNA polymerase sigma factor (sigma-70 family)
MVENQHRLETTLPEDMQQTESRLAEAAQRDPAAFVWIYDYYCAAIYRYLYSHLSCAQDAEDLTAQVFLKAFQNFPQYRHRGSLTAWLFTIARNLVKDAYRTRKMDAPLEAAESAALNSAIFTQEPISREMEREEQRAQLRRALRKLPAQEQELIRLRFTANLSFAQIAELLHKNEAAVKKQLYRLLARLEHQMEDADA